MHAKSPGPLLGEFKPTPMVTNGCMFPPRLLTPLAVHLRESEKRSFRDAGKKLPFPDVCLKFAVRT